MNDNPVPAHCYLIGQRVIVNGREIGVVTTGNPMQWGGVPGVWVKLQRGASCFDVRNVEPLPGGQL